MDKKAERELWRAVLMATAAFAVILGLALALRGAMPRLLRAGAESALESGNIEKARRIALRIDGSDGRGYLNECDYRDAAALMDAGDLDGALALLSALGDYKDARELARQCRGGEAQRPSTQAALNPRERELEEKRAALPRGIVDAGFYHTLALKSDGTALACGRNDEGQCAVEAWEGITAVAAGAYHSLGLRADGTVCAAGRDSEGQCQVSSWRDIVQIAAADYASFGLKSDGSVVCAGLNDYAGFTLWDGVALLSGGSYDLAALLPDGSALINHETARSDDFTRLADIAVNTAYAIGVKYDGSVVSSGFDAQGWRDVLAVSAGSTQALALTEGGQVLTHGFRPGSALDASALADVVAMAAAGTHWVFVLGDGRVIVLGDNGFGQANTGDWRLF